jgi:hypothetical protein
MNKTFAQWLKSVEKAARRKFVKTRDNRVDIRGGNLRARQFLNLLNLFGRTAATATAHTYQSTSESAGTQPEWSIAW